MTQLLETKLQPGEMLSGFTIEHVTPLPDLRVVAIQATHRKSGAKFLHLYADDSENLFSAAFRTPPPDDTGLPHILEHTVLCGSQKYPVKDPFVELLKTSLATFLNAMTYPDKTVYPCASMNEKDFFNLAGVYCDAVFRPLITEQHFKQEGHHFEFTEPGNPDSALMIKGVVYNEMRGAYSDLDGIIDRNLVKSICPDNAYGRDSGGDPEEIPGLTYEQFAAFHQSYYHPSNALLFVYGNIPTEKHLAFLDAEYLSGFDAISIDTSIADQPRWSEPVRATIPYPVVPGEEGVGKTAIAMTFLTNDVTDPIQSLSMHLLDYYLLGNAASPLRKALIDSKLGEELTDSGYAAYQRDTYFSVGLKGSEPDCADALVALVRSTCSKLVVEGLERSKMEAAFHRLEIQSREIGSMYPLRLMDRVYNSWLYDADPLYLLRLNEHLVELRHRYKNEDGFFEKQLRTLIVENPHYSVLTFVPDNQYNEQNEKAFSEKMRRTTAELDGAARERIAREQEDLAVMQAASNTSEALATLPRLAKTDVSPEPMPLPTTVDTVAGRPFLRAEAFPNGINYLRLAFDLRGLDETLYDYMPLFGEAIRKMGAADLDYAAMAEREAACTGGILDSVGASGLVGDPLHVQPCFVMGMKALDSKLPEALDVLRDRILRADFSDKNRLRDVILQGRVHLHSQVIPSGNRFAALHAAQSLSRNASLAERFSGVTQIRLIDRLAEGFDDVCEELIERFSRIQTFLMNRARLTAAVVGSDVATEQMRNWYAGLLGEWPEAAVPDDAGTVAVSAIGRVGVATPAGVSYVASVLPAVGATSPHAPALLLLGTQLSYGFLWNEVRVKGGAYGARASYSPGDGLFSFSSYRDPRILETLAAYGSVFEYVRSEMDLSPAAIEQAIIGTIKALDHPLRPESAVAMALGRYMQGSTDAHRRAFRQRLLGLTGDDVRCACGSVLESAFADAPVCVISSRERLVAAASGFEISDL